MERVLQKVLFAVLLAASASVAGDEVPAATETAAEASAAKASQAAEREELMPGVPSTSLAGGDRRAPERAMDELLLERTEVTGNRELPKVLYIVPWQKSDPGALMGKPVNTLLDEVLAPLDREEFIRQVDYYSDLYDDEAVIPAKAGTAIPAKAGTQLKE